MTKTEEFKYWCTVHEKVLPSITVLSLAQEAMAELEQAYRSIQTCGSCKKRGAPMYFEPHGPEELETWWTCRDIDDPVRATDPCRFKEDSHWEPKRG